MLKSLPTRPRATALAASRVAIIASNYNEEFVAPMLAKTQQEILAIEPMAQIEITHAPGSFEIPFLTCQIIKRSKPDVVICLGVIFQGQTGHADLIAASVTDSLCRLSVKFNIPVIHAVLLLSNKEQAQERCIGDEFNRGAEAARAAIAVLREARTIIGR